MLGQRARSTRATESSRPRHSYRPHRQRDSHRRLQAGRRAADGAVPDLSVDGTIEIERLADVVYVGRPVFGQPDSTVSLFRIDPDGKGASRVPVSSGALR